MENFYEVITNNTVFLIIAILVVIMIILSIMKKLYKLFLVAVLVLAGYVGMLVYNGEKIPVTNVEIIEHIKGMFKSVDVDSMKEKGKEAVKESVKESVKEAVKESL